VFFRDHSNGVNQIDYRHNSIDLTSEFDPKLGSEKVNLLMVLKVIVMSTKGCCNLQSPLHPMINLCCGSIVVYSRKLHSKSS
jgi:hypothetical protein